ESPNAELTLRRDLPKGLVSASFSALEDGLGRAQRRLFGGKSRLDTRDLTLQVIDQRLQLSDRELAHILTELVGLRFLRRRGEIVCVHARILSSCVIA